MRITFSTAPARPKPKVGDRRMIKGVLHERQFAYARNARGEVIGLNCTGGRQNWVWVPVEVQP